MPDDMVVQTRELTKRYGDFVALDRLSIGVGRGRILGFIGPNGAGKTTAIKILVGLARPSSGEATVAGADCVRDARRIKGLVGYMPDVFGGYENMRVREYLDFFGAAFRIPRRERQKRIDACLEITGSAWLQDRYVEALSHGMRQRVGLTRTLLHDPEVLILDEPANGLDPQARIEMRQILLRLAEIGKTLIVTSHILPELARICDSVAIVIRGRLQAYGPLDRIMRQIRQRRVVQVQLADRGEVVAAAERLREMAGPEAEVTVSEAEAEIRFTTDANDRELARILQGLASAGFALVQFGEIPVDLEDAFLSVMRRSDAEGAEAESGAIVSPQTG